MEIQQNNFKHNLLVAVHNRHMGIVGCKPHSKWKWVYFCMFGRPIFAKYAQKSIVHKRTIYCLLLSRQNCFLKIVGKISNLSTKVAKSMSLFDHSKFFSTGTWSHNVKDLQNMWNEVNRALEVITISFCNSIQYMLFEDRVNANEGVRFDWDDAWVEGYGLLGAQVVGS